MKTREKLIDTAIKLFVQSGYDGTSIDGITKACRITKGAFYHHFKNKDEIAIEAFNVIVEEVKSWVDKKTKGADTLEKLIYAYFDFGSYFSFNKYYKDINSDVYKMLKDSINKFPHLKSTVHEKILGNKLQSLKEKIDEAKINGDVKQDINSEILSLHILHLAEGLLHISALTGSEEELIENGKKMADNLWSMIST